MIPAYLYFNAQLYAGFAAWCTISAASTSRAIGYLQLSAGDESEYRVVYGGLQLGLVLVFLLLARRSELWEIGLVFALAVYVPIADYRIITMAMFWPVPGLTVAVGAMEVALLVAATLLWATSH